MGQAGDEGGDEGKEGEKEEEKEKEREEEREAAAEEEEEDDGGLDEAEAGWKEQSGEEDVRKREAVRGSGLREAG